MNNYEERGYKRISNTSYAKRVHDKVFKIRLDESLLNGAFQGGSCIVVSIVDVYHGQVDDHKFHYTAHGAYRPGDDMTRILDAIDAYCSLFVKEGMIT